MVLDEYIPRKTKVHLSSLGYIFIIISLIGVYSSITEAFPGAYGSSSPISCSDNCSGAYEKYSNTWQYCDANPVICFNTIDGCKDGSVPVGGIPTPSPYEWVENITITNLNRTENFTEGDIVEIHAVFQCDYEVDEIAFLYNNGTGWQKRYYGSCSGYESVEVYYNITLDGLNGNHTIRAIIAYGGNPEMTCGYDYDPEYSDTDDISLFVHSSFETNSPSLTVISPVNGATFEYVVPKTISLNAKAIDDLEVDSVIADISWGSNIEQVVFTQFNQTNWISSFTKLNMTGRYNMTFTANDTNNNINTSTIYFFVNKTSSIDVYSPINEKWYPDYTLSLDFIIDSLEKVNWTGYSLNGDSVINTTDNIYHSNGDNQTIYGIDDSLNISQSINLTENMTIGKIRTYLKSKTSQTSNISIQLRDDSSGNPGSILVQVNRSLALSNETYQWVDFDILNPLSLEENTLYWIHIINTTELIIPLNKDNYPRGDLIINSTLNNTHDSLFSLIDEYHYRLNLTVPIEINNITLYADTSYEEGLHSAAIEFYVDRFAPEFGTIAYLPSTQENIDPGKPINVSLEITDEFNISSSFLEYKEENDVSWTGVPMQNVLDEYYANFTPSSEGNYTFRIWANDTLSNEGYSENTTIEVLYEKDYYINKTLFNATKGTLPYSNTSLGNIKIKNTGDLDISFIINKSADTIPLMYFDNQTTLNFTLSADQEKTIDVIATGIQENTRTPIKIQVKPDYDPVQLINGTLASFSSNEYLLVTITEYDPTVTQGDARITLAGKIENLGNQIAKNVTINWSIPSGWTSKENLTENLGDIVAYSPKTTTITISVGSAAPTGESTIRLSAKSNETNNSDEKTVTVEPKSVEQPVPKTSGKTETITVSAPGGFIEVGKPELIINMSDMIEIVRGEKGNFTINITNEESKNITNITLSLKSSLFLESKIIPDHIDTLEARSSKEIIISLNVPIYANPGRYGFLLDAGFIWKGETIISKKEFMIIILDNDIANFTGCLLDAGDSIKAIESDGYDVKMLKILLKESNQALIGKEYTKSLELCKEIFSLIGKKEEAERAIKEIEVGISGGRIDNLHISESLSLTKEAFEKGEYGLAAKRAEETQILLEIEKNRIGYKIKNAINAIISNWPIILIVSILLGGFAFFLNRNFNINYNIRKLKNLEEEERSINELISKAQEYRYKDHMISKKIYEQHLTDYRQGLAKLQKEKNDTFLKINRLRGFSGRDSVKSQLDMTISFKKELQKNFYVNKSIDERSYKALKTQYDLIISDLNQKEKELEDG